MIDTASNTVTATLAVGSSPAAFGLFIGPGAATGAIGPIPTLSEWALLAQAGMLGLWGMMRLRRKEL